MIVSLIERLSKVYPKSLIAEFRSVFGDENTEKILSVFGGMTLHIPSHSEIQKAKRDLTIYEALAQTKGSAEFKRVRRTIQAKYGMTKGKVRRIFRYMAKLHKSGESMRKADEAVSKRRRRKAKVKTKRRKW